MALLELDAVTADYGPIKALHGVSLKVEPGEIVALLGANGAGKTTTLRAISGTCNRGGRITFEGRSLRGVAAHDTARRGIGHVPEGRGTLVQLTVWDNLRMGAYTRTDKEKVSTDYDLIFGYFPILKERRDQHAGTLSGGEQQMLAIARALMARPRLLLLDEPSLGLAPLVVQSIFEIITSINADEGVAVLLVEQNASLALKIAHRAYLLETGTVAASGDARTMAADESIRRSYLGY
ncbi:MAG: branched-chain amino acid transport system ATP-binding protein [Chloroflexota bacterium]|nr:branched-chain amino acid transport system ATP-binding protein [Chloroflexota bacterium]